MAAIDYYGVATSLKAIFDADVTLGAAAPPVMTVIEEEIMFGVADNITMIAIYMDRRDPHPQQSLAMGTRQRYLLQLSLWCIAFNIGSLREAINERDTLMGKVEIATMNINNRTISGKASSSWLGGGEMFSAKNPKGGFVAVGEVLLTADVQAVG